MSDSTSHITAYTYLKYLPEVDYWFSKYWKDRGELTIFHVNTPETFEYDFKEASFIELLFREVFDYDHYNYGFKQVETSLFPPKILDRVLCKSKKVKAFVTDSTGSLDMDVYPLTEEELSQLDKLYSYRNGFDPGMGDSTSSFVSKLAYYVDKYLKLKVNRDYSWVFSSNDVPTMYPNAKNLENLFEIYVLNEAHKEIKGWDILLDSGDIHIYAIRNRFVITAEQALDNRLHVPEPAPYDLSAVEIYLNGDLLDPSSYNLTTDSSSLVVAFSTADIDQDDVVIIDYTQGVVTNG